MNYTIRLAQSQDINTIMKSTEFINQKLPGKGTSKQSPIGSISNKRKNPVTAKDRAEIIAKQIKK